MYKLLVMQDAERKNGFHAEEDPQERRERIVSTIIKERFQERVDRLSEEGRNRFLEHIHFLAQEIEISVEELGGKSKARDIKVLEKLGYEKGRDTPFGVVVDVFNDLSITKNTSTRVLVKNFVSNYFIFMTTNFDRFEEIQLARNNSKKNNNVKTGGRLTGNMKSAPSNNP